MSVVVAEEVVALENHRLIIRVERLRASSKHYLVVYRVDGDGSPLLVYRSKAFLTSKDLALSDKKIERILAKLEASGIPILVARDDIVAAIRRVVEKIPSHVYIPVNEFSFVYRRVRIEDIDTSLLYQPIEIEAQIVGASEFFAIPIAFKFVCKKHGEVKRIAMDITKPKQLEKVLFKQKQIVKKMEIKLAVQGAGCSFVEDEDARVYVDLKKLILRDLPENVDKFSESLQYKEIECYLIGKDIPRSKRVRVRGFVIPKPEKNNTYRLVIAAFDIEPLNEVVERFRVSEDLLHRLRSIAPPMKSLDPRDWYEHLKDLADTVLNPRIVGRRFEKLANVLALVSPDRVVFESGSEAPFFGMINIMNFGDTKTGKTQTALYIVYVLGLGEYVTAETGSRTGLVYTIDNERKIVIWGVIPLCDREAVIIDGFNMLKKDEMAQLREVLETKRVKVRRVASGDAWARTRIIAIANPRKKMSRYAFAVEALRDIPSLAEEPDFTRFDLFVPWSENDVPMEDIVNANRPRNVEKEELFRKLVLLAWNVTAIIPRDVEKELNEIVLDVMKRCRGLDIPVIHRGWKKVVAKIAASFAVLLQNFEIRNGVVYVRVSRDALELTKIFLNEYIDKLEIEEYIETLSREVDDDQVKSVIKDLTEEEKLILVELYRRGGRATYAELAASLGGSLSIKQETLRKRRIPKLKARQLVTTIPGKGVVLTKLGEVVAANIVRYLSKEQAVTG